MGHPALGRPVGPHLQTPSGGLLRIETVMKRALFCTMTFVLLTSVGCTPAQRDPEAIRQDTAKATTEASKDAKAVVQGVEDALKTKGSVDINKATPQQLRALPGINSAQVHRIIAGRPYASTDELVKRHLVSKTEYDRIADQVVAD
jgi:competence protein ComEA